MKKRHFRMGTLLGIALLLAAPASPAQQPTEMGWPQPVHNNLAYSYVILHQNEIRTGNGDSTYRWEGEGWYGGNINRAWFKTEGSLDLGSDSLDEGELQGLYSHAISSFFDLQTGARYNSGTGRSRGWGVVGVQGLAPGFFELNTAAFASTSGHYAARIETTYDLLITQWLVLQPQIEINLYSKSDPGRRIGAGVSSLDSGLRLRYHFEREIAPYIGVTYEKKYGGTASYAHQAGLSGEDFRFVTGLRVWF